MMSFEEDLSARVVYCFVFKVIIYSPDFLWEGKKQTNKNEKPKQRAGAKPFESNELKTSEVCIVNRCQALSRLP